MSVKTNLSKAPNVPSLRVQSYERYLPSAFDDSLSMLEKINKMIHHLNLIGDISNDVVSQWNETVEWITANGLSDVVSNEIDKRIKDGTFDELIINIVGNLSLLETTDKTDMVNAINEVNKIVKENDIEIGDISKLDTENKESLVNAINEMLVQVIINKNAPISIGEATGNGAISGLKVTQQSVLAMAVEVGDFVTPNIVHMKNGVRYTPKSMSIAVDKAHTTLNRIDIVFVDDRGSVVYKAGAPNANPVPPELPNGGELLAEISVQANDKTINDIDIIDKRSLKSLSELATNSKDNLVLAINEVVAMVKDYVAEMKTDLDESINSVLTTIDTEIGKLGNKDDLNTTDKTTFVSAINEVIETLHNEIAKLGDKNDLNTTDKTTFVSAINEVIETLYGEIDNLGDKNGLNTTDKTSFVNAINEVIATLHSEIGNLGDLNQLTTIDKSTFVNSINEVVANLNTVISDLDEENSTIIQIIDGLGEQVDKNTNNLKGRSVNVKSFGAKGDGITDDTQAILTALASTPNGTYYFPAGRYVISDTIPVKQNSIITGDGIRSTTFITTTSKSAFKTQYHDVGATQQYKIQNLNVISNPLMSGALIDLTGTQYGEVENVQLWYNDGLTGLGSEYSLAKGISFNKGKAEFCGYLKFKSIYVAGFDYGVYGEGNDIVIEGGGVYYSKNYGMYLTPANAVAINGTEFTRSVIGGLYFDGVGLNINACWFEYNGTRVVGQYSPNDIEVTPASKGVDVGSSVFDNPNIGIFHGESARKGYEPYNAITGNGEVSLHNVIPNGNFELLGNDNEPLGLFSHVNTVQSFQKLTTGLPPRYRSGIRMIYKSGVPKLYKTLKVSAGEVISFVGWIRASAGLTNCLIGISNDVDSSTGYSFNVLAGATPRNKWYRVQIRYVVPEGQTSVRLGCMHAYGGTANVDYVDFAGWTAYRGEHVFFDGDAPITSAGGEVWSQEFKIGGKRHGFGTVKPTTGAWSIGDIVYNTSPTTSIGWVCVASGTPGTWKEFGAII